MFTVSSGRARAAGGILEASTARLVSRGSVAAAIRHGFVVGAAATVLQVLLLVLLLYVAGIIEF